MSLSLCPSVFKSEDRKGQKMQPFSLFPMHTAASFAGSVLSGPVVYHIFLFFTLYFSSFPPGSVHAQAANLIETLGSICSF
jgi:hypothetical protein